MIWSTNVTTYIKTYNISILTKAYDKANSYILSDI